MPSFMFDHRSSPNWLINNMHKSKIKLDRFRKNVQYETNPQLGTTEQEEHPTCASCGKKQNYHGRDPQTPWKVLGLYYGSVELNHANLCFLQRRFLY
jgi:hypothetical protein